MKLISKTLLYFLLISIPLLILAGLLSYYLIKKELRDGADESIMIENLQARKIIDTLSVPRKIYLSSDRFSRIQPVTTATNNPILKDSMILNKIEQEYYPVRLLRSYYKNHDTTYEITIIKTTIEEDELLESIFLIFGLIFTLMIIAVVLSNWLISRSLWKPFYKTLSVIDQYDINSHAALSFPASRTNEFNRLNVTLNKMIDKIYSDYQLQKEFTENASHEMQTPVAVLKANLNILMQSPNLKEEEMNQLQSMDNTIKKLSSLNKALLLLSKIENKQFTNNEEINIGNIIHKVISNLNELIESKGIRMETRIQQGCIVNMDPALADIIISNLFQNAVRHNMNGGKIHVELTYGQLAISNSGDPLNIPEEDLFTRFKKNDSSKESLGLGLSIVKSIVQLYGFKINYSYKASLHQFIINFH